MHLIAIQRDNKPHVFCQSKYSQSKFILKDFIRNKANKNTNMLIKNNKK